jgi:hypothetical protein
VIFCIKRYPTELQDSLFEVFKLLVCFHIQNEENLGSWWQGLACMDFLDFWYVISRDQIRIFETPSFLISALFKIITPP